MGIDREMIKWNAIAFGVGAVASTGVEQVLSRRWRKIRGLKPPDPADRSRSLIEAIMWRMAAGAAVGVVSAFTRRSTSVLWERYAGSPPPGIRGQDTAGSA